MKKDGFYSSGEFAHKAQVSVRTIRFYDNQDILKPSLVEKGSRYYTDDDFSRLQQILLLKYLGFSLEDIKEMTIGNIDYHIMQNSLELQKKLIQDRIEQMQLVEQAINSSIAEIKKKQKLDGNQMLNLIHLTSMENSLKAQYQNSGNIDARIKLHRDYSTNPQGWFPWIFDQIPFGHNSSILELGCGNGTLWTENIDKLPQDVHITLSDISSGMVRDIKRSLGSKDKRFSFLTINCENIPFEAESFNIIIANHVLFYCQDVNKACQEIHRVLKPGGIFICSTYGSKHMQEVTQLVQQYDERIQLSNGNLFDKFGFDNGRIILEKEFSDVELIKYIDSINIRDSSPLINYILSCHGNQNQFLSVNFSDFKKYVEKELTKSFHITKDAGIYICR